MYIVKFQPQHQVKHIVFILYNFSHKTDLKFH